MLRCNSVCRLKHFFQSLAMSSCLLLAGCVSTQVGDSTQSISGPAETETASANSGAADAFAAVLGGAALGALVVAGASGDVGQQALAQAAATADNPEAASIVGAVQSATAPFAAANEAGGTQLASLDTAGSGNCEARLREADAELGGYQFRNTTEQIEATMYVLNKQITIIDQLCPRSAEIANLRAMRVQQFNSAQRACDQISVKSHCVAQWPGQYEGIGSNATIVTGDTETPAQPNGPRPISIKRGCSNSSPGEGVCVVQ